MNSERVVLRVVAEDGQPAAPGARGRIVVTALENYVMPFISYDIGDSGVASAPCPCGRGFPTLAGIEGRLGGVIRTPAGRIISPVTLDGVFRSRGDTICEYQADSTASDAITVRAVPTSRFSPAVAATLQAELALQVGAGVAVHIEAVARILPEPSGKRLVIKSPAGGSPPVFEPRARPS